MLCQNCAKAQATTHIKRVVNGETTQHHLCSQCAKELGYTDMFSGFAPLSLSDFFSDFLGDVGRKAVGTKVERCPKCGNSFNDIVRESRLGCAECYRIFFDKLQPSLERIHGRALHSGKKIEVTHEEAAVPTKEEQIAQLKLKLEEAVKEQEFEQAAKLRDEIRELEGGEGK